MHHEAIFLIFSQYPYLCIQINSMNLSPNPVHALNSLGSESLTDIPNGAKEFGAYDFIPHEAISI